MIEKLSNKTCRECIFYHPVYTDNGICTLTEKFEKTCDFVYACKDYLLKPKPTNRAILRQMSNEEFRDWYCEQIGMAVALMVDSMDAQYRHNVLEWLNAPAESKGR